MIASGMIGRIAIVILPIMPLAIMPILFNLFCRFANPLCLSAFVLNQFRIKD